MTWTDSATNGSSFQILKSGIWSINFTYYAAGGTVFVDVSTNSSGNAALPTSTGAGDLIVASTAAAGANFLPISFVGYLGSNTGRHYRFNTNVAPPNPLVSSNARPYLNIALLYETPNITPTFP
jgi:hypothetical protein